MIDSGTDAPLSLQLHRERGGPVIAVEPVEGRDLVDALAELWFESDLRHGRSASGLGEVSAQVRTVERHDSKIGAFVAGFELERSLPEHTFPETQGSKISRYFPREYLEHVAARRAKQLVAEGQLDQGELYYYGVVPSSEPVTIHGPEGRKALSLASVPLRVVREGAEGFEMLADDDDFPVFFTRVAREQAERVSRKGGDCQPPVETGGLFLGGLYQCPETGEMFAVIERVIEATESEATTYSLTYSGPTWSRIQTIVQAQQRRPATRHHRILGQCHGHNFLPLGGAEQCEACELVPVCTRSSAYLSSDDRVWCRAVFSGEPWQISQIFGLDARSGLTETFYGQRNGALERRGYYVIDELDPSWLPSSPQK